MAERTCVECGGPIIGRQQTAILCGKDCARERMKKSDAYKRAKAKHQAKKRKGPKLPPPGPFDCDGCGRPCVPGVDGVGAKARRFCGQACKKRTINAERRRRTPSTKRRQSAKAKLRRAAKGTKATHPWLSGFCPRCGESVTRKRTGGSLHAPGTYCSHRCQRADARARNKYSRRMRQAVTRTEPISRRRVMERDGWRCQLCGKKIPQAKAVPHPSAATLDHVIPLSKGGSHTYTNLQAAHYACNTAKGNRGTDQLRLIG